MSKQRLGQNDIVFSRYVGTGLLTELIDHTIQKPRSARSDRGGIACAPGVPRPVQLPSGTGTCYALTRWRREVCYPESGSWMNVAQLLRQKLTASGEQQVGFDGAAVPGAMRTDHVGSVRLHERIDQISPYDRARVLMKNANSQPIQRFGR